MPRRVTLHAPLRTVTIGDRSHRIRILKRTQLAPVAGSTDFTERFDELDRVWADVRTKSGVFFFDGVNAGESGDVPVSHEVLLEYHKGLDGETWLELDGGSRLRVLHVDDLGERHLFQRLICAERGPDTVAAAHA